MKRNSISILLVLSLILGSFSFPNAVFASDSGDTAREVAQDATEKEWQAMKDYFTQTEMPADEDYIRSTQFPDDFQADCVDWIRNEYAYTGPAKMVITNMTSSDPDTVAVSYTKNNVQLKRGKGKSSKVTINIEYHFDWSFKVKEKTIFGYVTVNDRFGPSGTFTDSFTVDVMQNSLTVLPKKGLVPEVEMNMFMPINYDPIYYVDISNNTGPVSAVYKESPDDSKIGTTTSKVIFQDNNNSVVVDIPFNVVDTTPPTGTLKNPLEAELGSSPNNADYFENPPYDNDGLPVIIHQKQRIADLGLGNHPFELELNDAANNKTLLNATITIKDTTPPTVQTKDLTVDFGAQVKPEDFIQSATDNDKKGKISYTFNKAGLPDTNNVGNQLVMINATDASGNVKYTQAKMTVKKDTTPPTATGIQQFIPLNGKLPTDVLSVLKDIRDDGDAKKITGKYKQLPDTAKLGLTKAIVELTDGAGNKNDIQVPVFVVDRNSVHDDQFVLNAENFTMYSNEIDAKTLPDLILKKSRAAAWQVSDGKDVSNQIKVLSQDVKPAFGSYKATIAIGKVSKEIQINVLNATDLIDLAIPKNMVFGSTDANQGKIISPSYKIKNNSKAKIKVVLQQAQPTANSEVQLLQSNDQDPSDKTDSARLFLNSGQNKIKLDQQTADQSLGVVDAKSKAGLTLSGQYFGDYANAKKLNLDLTFKFEVLP